MKRLALALCALAVIVAPIPARALGLCTVGPLTGLDFGAYDVFASAAKQVPGSLTVGCVGLISTDRITVTLSKGSSGTYAARTMKLGAYALAYNIYLGGYTVVFGDGTSGTATFGPVAPSALVLGTLTVDFFAEIPARQNVPAGIYNDVLTVTVNF